MIFVSIILFDGFWVLINTNKEGRIFSKPDKSGNRLI